jgi:hypothetical protein
MLELIGDVDVVESRLEIVLTHPMEILGDEAQVEARFGPFRDIVSVHDLHPTYHRLKNHFGRTRWYS